jgi:hypothetical protein
MPVAPVPRKALLDIARGAGSLLRDRSWLHRRVHRVSFTETGLVRNEISIDFSLPADLEPYEELADGRFVYFVPVLALRKWPPLMRLDLRDQDGHPFPLLTTGKNETIDGEALAAMAPSGKLKDTTAVMLRRLPGLPADEAEAQLDALSGVVQGLRHELTRDERRAWRATLLTAASLASNLILWAKVEGRPEERLIIKVGYEHPLRAGQELWRRMLASLSWAPLRLQVTVQDIGFGTSYHLQVEPPQDLEVHRARLQILNPAETTKPGRRDSPSKRLAPRHLWWALMNTVRVRSSMIRQHSSSGSEVELDRPKAGEPWAWQDDDRAYLYVTGERGRVGVAQVDLATSRRGFRPSALLMGLTTTIFLGAMAALAPHVVNHLEATVATLLVVPLVLAYLLVPTGEHPLVRARLAGVRVLVAVIAVLPVLAALTLLSFSEEPDGDVVRWWWLGLTAIGGLTTAGLVLSWLLPPIKDRPAEYRKPLAETRPG